MQERNTAGLKTTDTALFDGAQENTAAKVRPINRRAQATSPASRNLSAILRQWHQRAGLFAFLFMGWLGFSGLLLNQSADWGLDAIRVKSQALMALYGLHTELPGSGYFSSGHWLVTTTENTVLDGQALGQHIPSPLGFVSTGRGDDALLFVATSDTLTVLSAAGERVDELSDYMLPVGSIRGIGVLRGDRTMVALKGESTYISSDGLAWQKLEGDENVVWSTTSALDAETQAKVERYARPTMALEQVLIDLHSGRLFGQVGPYVINAVGIASMWLSLSGVWMVWRSNRRRRPRT